ncbi:MAG TPA: sulfatase-like hydrolase/transferase, partial [Thermoanaerobaculia bacterium]|nr:sulfatase-like hydrolase/transferase [Thermoanaerobaculia bacterium]
MRWPCRLCWLWIALPLGLLGCGAETSAPWRQVDLWATPQSAGTPSVRRTAPLGPEEVRNPALLQTAGPAGRRRVERLSAATVNALEQAAGATAAWRLELGASPYFAFTPLPAPGRSCPCAYRVAVRDGAGELSELRRIEMEPGAEPGTAAAPATVYVDLARYAGRQVELVLALEGPQGASALWGSPAVYDRGRPASPPRDRERPNVLILGLDTLRADALGAYGRVPSVTPAMDRLAGESDVWLEAFSCFNVTNPSFVSLMTGLYGKHHGIYDFDTRLAPSQTTLAEVFSGLGYDTRAILSIDHLADARSGLGQGFGDVVVPRDQFAAEYAVGAAMDWIGRRERPFFLWLHLFDAHTPHTPPQPFASGFRPETLAGLVPPRDWLAFRSPGPRGY